MLDGMYTQLWCFVYYLDQLYADISGYEVYGEYKCAGAVRRAGASLDDCASECDQESNCNGMSLFCFILHEQLNT